MSICTTATFTIFNELTEIIFIQLCIWCLNCFNGIFQTPWEKKIVCIKKKVIHNIYLFIYFLCVRRGRTSSSYLKFFLRKSTLLMSGENTVLKDIVYNIWKFYKQCFKSRLKSNLKILLPFDSILVFFSLSAETRNLNRNAIFFLSVLFKAFKRDIFNILRFFQSCSFLFFWIFKTMLDFFFLLFSSFFYFLPFFTTHRWLKYYFVALSLGLWLNLIFYKNKKTEICDSNYFT